MNRTLSDWKFSAGNDGHHYQKYEMCRKQSACYLLAPPPRPPTIPELFLTTTCKLSSSSSPGLTQLRQRTTDSSYLTVLSIILGIFIALASACLILFLLGVKFRFHQKFRCRRRRAAGITSVNSSIREGNNSDVAFIKTTNPNGNLGSNSSSGGGGDGCASFSSTAPASYGCLTPLTTTTIAHNQYPSLTMTHHSNLSLHMAHSHPNLPTDEVSSHRNSTNIYEEIRPTYDRHPCYCCCSCTLAHYQSQPYTSSTHHLMPHYYTCEPPPPPPAQAAPSAIVCQSCLLETLHRKQSKTSSMNCACHNFFVPIK